MIIGIDGNEANFDKKVGVHQMAFELLWGFYKLNSGKVRSYKLQDTKNSYVIYLKSPPRDELPPENDGWHYKIMPATRLWILSKLMPALYNGDRPDVFFTPSHYLPLLAPMPMVCMITDVGYLEFTGQFRKFDYWQLKIWTAISLIVSKYIIAISDSTKKDIVRHYKFTSKKIKVVLLGPNKSIEQLKITSQFVRQILKNYRITKKYLVFVSTLKPGKNVEGLVESFAMLKSKDYQLVVAGKKGWLYDSIFKKVKKLGITQDVIFTDYVSEKEKKALIQNARALVAPSFWEGFGIDVLNAFSVGTPVVVSNVASLPEVAGKAGIYVDPYSIVSIYNGLKKVINMSPTEYNKQVRLGYLELKRFSWDKSAFLTSEVLKKAVNSK
jgi:glycosyltransferase involved in cell wall biosynthesis